MSLVVLGAATAAGVLTVLSPCVLPILPIVFSAAASQHRFGPAALAGGVAVSFAVIGVFLATTGAVVGLDGAIFHRVIGAFLIALGLVMIIPRFHAAFEAFLSPFSSWAAGRTSGVEGRGLWGQAGLGALMGAIWSPCVGPTLGAATVLASQGKDLGAVSLTMGAFAVGAAAPLLAVGSASRSTLQRWRGGLAGAERWGRYLLGGGLVLVGLLAISGLDKALEAVLVRVSPQWLTNLTSSI